LTSENNNTKKNYNNANQDEEMPSVEERAKARKEEKGE
jgi:hypothetical protein